MVLYVQQMIGPLDELLMWLDEIQVGATSLARVIGIADVPPDREATGESPGNRDVAVRDVTYAYRAGRDVLNGVSLDLAPGERLAIVGPSGAGKSTLGRLLAGIDGPRSGRVEVGGVRMVDLELEQLRGQVALVTQEHHVFVGTLTDNLLLARPGAGRDELWAALRAVDGDGWAAALPDGLDTVVGSGGPPSDRGTVPAARTGPARPGRPAHAGAGRGHLAARPARRPAPRAFAGRGRRGPHRRRDRAPPAHGA